MYVSRVHRNPSNNFSEEYNKSSSKWDFKPCQDLMEGKHSHFHVLTSFKTSKPDNKEFDCDMLTLFGIFVSDGTLNKKNNKQKYRAVRIYQSSKGGKQEFIDFMDRVSNRFGFRRYTDKKGEMIVWVSHYKVLVNNLQNIFGHGSHRKRLNKIIYNLSSIQIEFLLHGMFLGDGSRHPTSEKGWIYHSVNKNLANDVQIAAMLSGYDSKVMGPYKSEIDDRIVYMYQVWVTYKKSQPKSISFNTYIKKYPDQWYAFEHIWKPK
jgi:hypothetical protein